MTPLMTVTDGEGSVAGSVDTKKRKTEELSESTASGKLPSPSSDTTLLILETGRKKTKMEATEEESDKDDDKIKMENIQHLA